MDTPLQPSAGSLTFAGIAGYQQPSAAGPIDVPIGSPGGVSAVYNITGAILIKGGPGILASIICTTADNITVHDCNSAAAANAANLIGTYAMAPGTAPLVTLNWPCSNGIYVSGVTSGLFSIAYT